MKRTATVIALFMAVVLVTLSPVAYSQGAPAAPAAAADKVFEGQLTKVDTAMKQIMVRGIEDKVAKEMSFAYTDDTAVVGGDKTIQGLAGKTGAQLKISYKVERGTNQATKIELLEKQP